MSDCNDYGFCPRCGALMQDGVCMSCGFGGRAGAGVQVNVNPNPQYGQPLNKKKNKLVIGLCIAGIVLLLLALIASASFFIYAVSKNTTGSTYQESFEDEYGSDYYDDYGDYDDGYYEPDPDDPFYKEIADAISEDYNYHVIWYSDSIDPDDSENYEEFYATYPMLEGENQEILDRINYYIQEAALTYKKEYKDYKGGCSSYGYVTYMDEEKCSIVIQHSLLGHGEIDSGAEIRLESLNFNILTGEMIQNSEMLELDDTVPARFRAQDKVQNGGVEFVQNLTDEGMLKLLQDPKDAVLFYTPVGLEVGFNYQEGWVTVTFKENAI